MRLRTLIIVLGLLPLAPAATAATAVLKVSAEQERALGLRVARAQAATQVLIRHLPGNVTAGLERSGAVTVPYAGVVTQVLHMEGEKLARGATLAIVQSNEVAQLGARSQRAAAEATLAGQRAARDRTRLDEGVSPRSRLEESHAPQRQAEADVAEAQLGLALAPRGSAPPGHYELRTPIAGRVLRRDVQPGDAVTAGAQAFLIGDDGALDVTLRVPLEAAARLRAGGEARLSGNPAVRGRVVSVAAATERGSQTVPVRARFGPDAGLVVGQQVAVDVALPAVAGALTVPQAAVVRKADTAYAFARAEGGFRAVPVQVLGEASDGLVVRGDLAPGTEVAVSATTALMAILATE
ncbi:MAG TPA: efflux RND transporter periplasmic adaptor subunit [Ideonella sp.]|nr:efflux RND transporter periplasmic adaptor subunit [Ideonella sp.]